MSIHWDKILKLCAISAFLLGNLYVTSSALETPFSAYKDGYANSAAYTGNSRTLIVRADSKAWMSHAFPEGSGKGLQGARLQVYVKDVVHDGVLKVYLAPAIGSLENQTHLSDLVSKDSVGSVVLKAVDHIQHVVEIPLSAAFTKAIQDNAYAGLVLESSGNLDVELGALEGDHGSVILLNYNSASTVVTANVISVDSLANKLFADHSTELRGPTGTNGSSGAKGDNGLNGKDGPQGPKGDSGARGPQGIKGDKGDPGAVGAKGDPGNAGSVTSLPAAAITGLDTFVVNRVNTGAAGKASLSGANFVGPLSTSGDFSAGGIMNVDASTPNSKYGLNVVNKYITATGGFGILLYGIGGPLETNNEWIQLSHGNNQGKLMVRAAGTGVHRDFGIYTSDVERYRVSASGLHSFKGAVNVTSGQGIRTSDGINGTLTLNGDSEGGIITTGKLQGGNRDLRFADTLKGELMRLTSQGNLGIGKIGPTAKLDILDTSKDLNRVFNTYLDYGTGVAAGGAPNAGYIANQLTAKYGSGSTAKLVGLQVNVSNAGSGKSYSAIFWGGNVGIDDSLPTEKLTVAGNIKANATTYTSDIRFKKEISPLDSSLQKIVNLQGVTYKWKMDEFPNRGFDSTTQIGLIAQEVEKIIPELVHTGSDGYKSVDYVKTTPILVEAIKTLKKQIESQQNQITELKSLICLDHPQSSQCK